MELIRSTLYNSVEVNLQQCITWEVLGNFLNPSTSQDMSGCVNAVTFVRAHTSQTSLIYLVLTLEGGPIIHPALSQGDLNQAVGGNHH